MHTSDVALNRTDFTVIHVEQGLGESLVSQDSRFAGFPDIVTFDNRAGRIFTAIPGNKKNFSVASPAGGTNILPVDPARRFSRHSALEFLTRVLARIGQQIEHFEGNAREIEGVLRMSPANPALWEIIILQNKRLSRSPMAQAA